ncbi:cache domain-containing sensor histidine kinase [Paenibacillus chungangensis]|uniref:Sensor histidine kinase n=1 Tax=Paenibacillus chungangensis TaxID=696535 RepID=A0ABW3HSU9_9BACL
MNKPSKSLHRQLFSIVLFVSLIPLFILSYFSQTFMFKASTNFITDNAELYMSIGEQKLDAYMSKLTQPINELTASVDFQQFLKIAEDREAAQKLAAYTIFEQFREKILSQPEIASILILHESATAYHFSSRFIGSTNYAHSFAHDPIYNQVFEMETPQLIASHNQTYLVNSDREVVSFIKPVKNFRDFTTSGWVIVELDTQFVVGMLEQIQSVHTGSIMLYNTKNESFISSEQIGESMIHTSARLLNKNGLPKSGSHITNIDSQKYLFTHQSLSLGDWRLVSFSSFKSLTQGIAFTNIMTVAIAVISLVAALILSYGFIVRLLKPLYKLRHGMNLFGMGMNSKVQGNYRNEFGFLIRTFNQMLDERDRMEKEVIQTTIQGKEKELLQLQAQVNPHFLFNTLSTIEALSEKGNQQHVSEIIHEIAQILRFNIRNDSGWVKLREEIEYIQHFQNIHFFRYDRAVNILYDFDPLALDKPFLKLGLQPFVENALKYGWNDSMNTENVAVELKGTIDDGFIRIQISDNGPGFDEEALSNLALLTAPSSDSLPPYFTMHTGIYNAFRRFQLVYGSSLSISFNNREHGGATIDISIPWR